VLLKLARVEFLAADFHRRLGRRSGLRIENMAFPRILGLRLGRRSALCLGLSGLCLLRRGSRGWLGRAWRSLALRGRPLGWRRLGLNGNDAGRDKRRDGKAIG